MGARILVINGHPDPGPSGCAPPWRTPMGRAPARRDARCAASFEAEAPPPALVGAQENLRWADHLVIVHPLWLGGVPALLKAFLEQVFRYGFAIPRPQEGAGMRGLLKGRSARLVVTRGMPAPVYRLAFGAFGTRAVERGVPWLSGFGPIRRT